MHGRALSSALVPTHRQQLVALVRSVLDSSDGLKGRYGVLNEIAIGLDDELCWLGEELRSRVEALAVRALGVASSTTAVSRLPTSGHAAVLFDPVTLMCDSAWLIDGLWQRLTHGISRLCSPVLVSSLSLRR
jgi:hypothetical protein